jgi:two-component system NtrC family sensor kinase
LNFFSHPSGDKVEKSDLNHAIDSTVTIARNERKLIADLDLYLDPDLPSLFSLSSDLKGDGDR